MLCCFQTHKAFFFMTQSQIHFFNDCYLTEGILGYTLRLTYQCVEDDGYSSSSDHAQDCFDSVTFAVDEHQSHVLEIAHRPSEELH